MNRDPYAWRRWTSSVAAGASAALGLALLAPAAAFAAPVDDLQYGHNIDVGSIKVHLDGQSSHNAGFSIKKPVGSLDLTMTLTAFGYPNSQPIHAQGTANGNVVEWSFNHTFNPPIDLGNSTDLDNVAGVIRVNTSPLSGWVAFVCSFIKCPRNVEYSLASGSWMTASGEGILGIDWSEPIVLNQFRGYAGAPAPDVRYFGMDNAMMGKESSDKSVPLHFNLDRTAPKGGAEIELVSSAPQFLSVPNTVVIPEGQWFGSGYGSLAPGFSGIVRVEARTPFGAASEAIHAYAYVEPEDEFDPLLVLPDWLAGCLWCFGPLTFDESWRGLGMLDGRSVYFTQERIYDVAEYVGVEFAEAVDVTSSGWITGNAIFDGETSAAFVAHIDDSGSDATWIGEGFSPVGVTDQGIVVGNVVDGEWTFAALYQGSEATLMELEMEWSEATAASHGGAVAGVAGTGPEQVAFSYVDGETMTFGFDEQPLRPVSINNAGDAVATLTQDGKETSYLLSRSGEVIPIEAGEYGVVTATAINELGWVVGTASNEESSIGFLWLPSGEFIDLNSLSPDENLEVTEALDINDNGEVLARTRKEEQENVFVLKF